MVNWVQTPNTQHMVAIAQLVERLIVVQVVTGSIPVSYPKCLQRTRLRRKYGDRMEIVILRWVASG